MVHFTTINSGNFTVLVNQIPVISNLENFIWHLEYLNIDYCDNVTSENEIEVRAR